MAKIRVSQKDFSKRFQRELSKEIDKRLKKAESKWKKPAIELLKDELKANYSIGESPVEGGGNQTGAKQKFAKYSDSYKKQIKSGRFSEFSKRITPVNLKLSGKMLNSLKDRSTAKGIVLWFTSPIAKYHNDLGAGKSKVIRKMVPDDGQKLRTSIRLKLQKLFTDKIDKT